MYRYRLHTGLSQVSGNGIKFVPNLTRVFGRVVQPYMHLLRSASTTIKEAQLPHISNGPSSHCCHVQLVWYMLYIRYIPLLRPGWGDKRQTGLVLFFVTLPISLVLLSLNILHRMVLKWVPHCTSFW